ncbi:VOC family protein [Bowmanella pacifica]|uniref:Ring-cleaving dioxygenase n=1 Tax=Bowmanella pacifica TaxID=502051 RepID=A0A917YTM8_9ALTE|nr:VOC family protein [Bowmanella pacifica]GGO66041.1 ring-cleaving dioxygenase [Bowmanella pacifica]
MVNIQAIDHLVLRVVDLERSVHFYQQVLGCEVVKRQAHLGLVHLRAGSSLIDLISLVGKLGQQGGRGPGVEGHNVDHFCLRIEPFDEAGLVAHLAAFGITPLGPASLNFGAEGQGLSLYFKDPDNNIIELKGPAFPAG